MGTFPKILKKVKVVPIFKSGQKDLFENYRPLTKTSNFSEVIEKNLKVRLLNFMLKYKLLNKFHDNPIYDQNDLITVNDWYNTFFVKCRPNRYYNLFHEF